MILFDLFKKRTSIESNQLDKQKKREIISRMHMKLINSFCPREREIWEGAIENTYKLDFNGTKLIEERAIVSRNLLLQLLKKEGKIRKKFEEEKRIFEEGQIKKGLQLFEGKWIKNEEIPKLKAIKIDLDNNFQNISPSDFERLIANLFTAMGYETKVTKQTRDFGIDVIAKKQGKTIAIQCKKYREGNPVGNRDIQRILGAMQLKSVKATHSILITTSHFTVQAEEQAKECAVELWNKEILHTLIKKYLMQIE